MRSTSIIASALALASSVVASPLLETRATADDYEASAVPCTSFTQRQEWSSMSAEQRTSYIDAVLCLQSSPSKIPEGVVPGALTRYDDFVATHINNTLKIHLNAVFLSWHRQYVQLYEKALQDECGYTGTQPYWDWTLYDGSVYNLTDSPLFDGSETSLSSNGVFDPTTPNIIVGGGADLGRGTGGGCVFAGPFKDHTPHLGPFAFDLVFAGGPGEDWTALNSRCFARDLSQSIGARYNNATSLEVLMATTDIGTFQSTMSGADINAGVHGGGHYVLGGAGNDFFASPNDPAFFLHHAMIDKVWADWQAEDCETRDFALNGTTEIFDPPTAPIATLDTEQSWDYLSPTRKTGEMMRVGFNGFCYEYV